MVYIGDNTVTTIKIIITVCLFCFGLPKSWASNAEHGQKLYQTCSACHGSAAEGNPELKAPSLAGQHSWYLTKQLNDLKSGIRGNHEKDVLAKPMRPFVSGLTDNDINSLSTFLSGLPQPTAKPELSGDLKNGFRYYQSKCGACHGDTGQGNKSFNAPKLSGLSGHYLKRQMDHFSNGIRGTHKKDKLGRQMALMARMTSGQELNDILFFLESQHK